MWELETGLYVMLRRPPKHGWDLSARSPNPRSPTRKDKQPRRERTPSRSRGARGRTVQARNRFKRSQRPAFASVKGRSESQGEETDVWFRLLGPRHSEGGLAELS